MKYKIGDVIYVKETYQELYGIEECYVVFDIDEPYYCILVPDSDHRLFYISEEFIDQRKKWRKKKSK